ncbi:unnamed protein product [Medioppia subpectinata]|uniref:C2H2-type domain-containing protein n=1 Tax=Medioppia subpectinata TaxID=1979941 RepID=A0A7R9L4Q4_9ACAR|nr:unnamed protein product [Medioppia subpectinata]CAG2115306.1 unnamed protein product [Medioppia subpectinata]
MESSRKAKSEIEVLDAALKDYEYKFKLRNNLRLASDAIDKDVDQLNKRRTALTAQMKVYNESHRSASSATSLPTPTVAPIARPPVDHSASSLLSTTSTADERQGQSSQRRPQQKERPQHLRPALTTHSSPTAAKRPNTLHTKPAANPKRVRINDVVSNTTPTAPVRTTPSLHTGLKPAIKRTPHPFRPKPALGTPTTPLATASPSTDSPKVSRLCRQQTPGPGGPRSTGLAPAPSGVRTSRPVRPGCSRANRTDNESTEAPEPSEPTHTSDQPMDNTEAADTAVDSADEAVSDNEIFNELVNTNIMNEKAAEEDAPVVTNRTPNTATTAATATQSTVNSDEILDNSVATGDQRDGPDPQPAPQDNAVNTGGDEIDGNDGPNAEPDVVTIDSDDEDEVFTAETQPTINVKTEKPDAMNGGNHSLNAAATRVLSDSAADLNASSAASDDSMASTSTSSTLSSTFNKKSLRYTGFPAVEYERTDGQEYSLGPFKPIFGPKSKTAGVGVITMKAFKDYLIASLADNTVRRFHIQNKSDVGMYGPHGNHVMALMIVESAKCADDYYLYTACKDKALRVFNARTTQLMGGISLGHTIYCLDYRWSHVFCGLENGTVCKVAAIHELESPPQVSADGAANTGGDTYEHLVKRYAVDAKKRILALVAVKATATVALPVDIEPVMAISHTKLRIVNTSDSVVNDKDRVLHSMPLNASNASPIFAKVFGDHLFLAFKVVGFKPEGQTKPNKDDDKSLLLMYDLQKDWNYVNKLEIPGAIMAVEMSGSDLIVCEYSGSVQCFACDHQFDFKWKAHPSVTISACVQLGSRLVLGTGSGQFEVIFLDQNPVDCDLCGITFVRDMDLKHHIKNEHNLSEPPAIGQ